MKSTFGSLGIVIVPDVSAVELVALAEREISRVKRFTNVDPDYANCDFYRGVDGKVIDGRGRKYEAVGVAQRDIRPSGKELSSEDVRTYFRDKGGYFGHTGAFIQWRTQTLVPWSRSYHASIPEDDSCGRNSERPSRPLVPITTLEDEQFWLRLAPLHQINWSWFDRRFFVAFREIL